MRYTESHDQAVEYTKAAMSFLDKHGLTPNPATMAVWYDYVSGANPGLVWAVDKVLNDEGALSNDRCEEIYERYLLNPSEHKVLDDASERLQSSMQEVRACIGEAGRDHGAYGEALIGISNQLEGGGTAEEVAGLVRGILSKTQQVIEKNKALEHRLAESSKEIEGLNQHLREMRQQAMSDPLTGIANRTYFDLLLREEAERAAREKQDLALIFAEIENFRAFKEIYGAEIGDEVIKFVAGRLGRITGKTGTPARYGGEEFAVILPRTGLPEAEQLADRIRQDLGANKLKNLKTGERYGAVSMCFGVAAHQSGEPLAEFVRRAIETLYQAKAKEQKREAPKPEPEAAASPLAGE
ncbi:MAG: GGDEF domain-containing protein [Kiloniellales bacterium]|nr:GGDEF domain-containing protein [Kiloniellales bacterium]